MPTFDQLESHPAERLFELWRSGARPDIRQFITDERIGPADLIEVLRIDQSHRWFEGERVVAETYFDQFPELAQDTEGSIDLIYSEVLVREQLNESVGVDEYEQRFPQFACVLRRQFELHHAMQATAANASESDTIGLEADHGADEPLGHFRHFEIPGYEIVAELGRGGMAVVYKARHLELQRWVALKVLLADMHASPSDRTRFRNEASAVARLQHPNIVQIFEIGEHQSRPYLALEYVDGGNLAEMARGKPQPPVHAASLLKKVAEAVEYAHRHGVIHRDLKPSNLLLQRREGGGQSTSLEAVLAAALFEGDVKIADFGLARILGDGMAADSSSPALTRTGDVLGTPSYMAPEQAAGRLNELGPTTDIFALGAILYELLTGRPPFQGLSSWEVLQQVIESEPIRPTALVRSIPRDVETICLKCLEKDPTRRYRTAGELAAELDCFLKGEPIRARPAGILRRIKTRVRRHPVFATGTALTILGVAVVGLLVTMNRQQVRQTQAKGIVETLMSADAAGLSKILDRLSDHPDTKPMLESAAAEVATYSNAWLNVNIALAAQDPTIAPKLAEYVSRSQPLEIPLLVAALSPYADQTAPKLWEEIQLARREGNSILQTTSVLSGIDSTSSQWSAIALEVVDELVRANPIHADVLIHATAPIRQFLREPLVACFRGPERKSSERLMAASILADHFGDETAFLCDLIVDADPDQFSLIIPRLHQRATVAVERLSAKAKPTPDQSFDQMAKRTTSSVEWLKARDRAIQNCRREALAAIALAHLDRTEELNQLLEAKSEPTARSFAIEYAARCNLTREMLIELFHNALQPAVRTGYLLALGQHRAPAPDAGKISKDSPGEKFLRELGDLYRSHPQADVRQASGWLLRKWGRGDACDAIDQELSGKRSEDRNWFVNKQGQTYVILPKRDYVLGSPPWEEDHEGDEVQHTVAGPRTLAVAALEVTIEQLKKFKWGDHFDSKYSNQPRGPAVNISWFDAAIYCRWLSEQEGLAEEQMCFPPIPEIKVGMTLPADYLDRTGYRLPIEAEWEYACRAGTTTSWSFGIAYELFSAYALALPASNNRAAIVGERKPNDWGLFDMHGNAIEWCANELNEKDPFDSGQKLAKTATVSANMRRTRGGYFGDNPFVTRSARRNGQPSESRWANTGFRPIRTLASSSKPQ